MVKVIINPSLEKAIDKKFKKQSIEVFKLIYSLKENPHKGKKISSVGGIIIKELKYENYRFYFIVDGNKLRIYSKKELENLLIQFITMSDKKHQQKTIDEIKRFLKMLNNEKFE